MALRAAKGDSGVHLDDGSASDLPRQDLFAQLADFLQGFDSDHPIQQA